MVASQCDEQSIWNDQIVLLLVRFPQILMSVHRDFKAYKGLLLFSLLVRS